MEKNDNKIISETIKNYEKIWEDYSKEKGDINLIKKVLDNFIHYLKGKKVLDVGCGSGRDSKYLSKNGFEVTGIDLSTNFIKIASKNIPNAKFLKMDMRKLEFPKESFDGIWACASFLHIPKSESKKTLLGFNKVLKNNGIMCISVKQGEGQKFIEGKYGGERRFFAFYDKEEFRRLIEDCSFKILKFTIDKKKDIWLNVFATK